MTSITNNDYPLHKDAQGINIPTWAYIGLRDDGSAFDLGAAIESESRYNLIDITLVLILVSQKRRDSPRSKSFYPSLWPYLCCSLSVWPYCSGTVGDPGGNTAEETYLSGSRPSAVPVVNLAQDQTVDQRLQMTQDEVNHGL